MSRRSRMAWLALLLLVPKNSKSSVSPVASGWVSSSRMRLPAVASFHPSWSTLTTNNKYNWRRRTLLLSLDPLTTRRKRKNLLISTAASATDVPLVHSSGGGGVSLWTGDDAKLPLAGGSSETKKRTNQWLIHWKGEAVDGSNQQFRHCEFYGALGATVGDDSVNVEKIVQFSNALQYRNADHQSNDPVMTESKIQAYNEAMQYLDIVEDGDTANVTIISPQDCIRAVQRCSLIHALYEIVAETDGETYDDLAVQALANGAFQDMTKTATTTTTDATWCVRVRHYGAKGNETAAVYKERRYGHRARSMALERQALQALKPLLLTFRGPVNLADPDCKIYILDGLTRSAKVLARRRATGARRTFPLLEPNTRHCVTTTPLGAVAAYTLVNVARVRAQDRILDPYAGSCTILLAAALVTATTTAGAVQSVGIEVAHNGYVNRDDIRTDFVARNLTLPAALIHGDCRDVAVRRQAIAAVGGPFDCIITDPPYGIRESMMGGANSSSSGSSTNRPIDDLLQMIVHDRDHGETRLLRKGGRLVVFLPQQTEEQSLLRDVLPSPAQLEQAGLQCELMREQPLNDKLSRWLVCYKCVR